jgi:N4-gp56 family major capsid protein
MAINTTSNMPPAVRKVLNDRLLSIKQPYLIHGIPAYKKKMPAMGDTIRFRRWNKLDTATVPLGNTAVTPPGAVLSVVDLDARMNYYGNYAAVSDQAVLQSEDPFLNELTKVLAFNLRETEDELIRKVLEATTVVINCTHGVNNNVPTEITAEDVLNVTRELQRNSAKSLMSAVDGANKYGSGPVPNSYLALGHVDIGPDLSRTDGFLRPIQYGNSNMRLEAEYGAVEQIRFLLSEVGSKVVNGGATASTDLYNIFVVGLEAYACVNQDSYDKQLIYNPPYDPLRQSATLGWKMSFAGRILNSEWILNMRATLGF